MKRLDFIEQNQKLMLDENFLARTCSQDRGTDCYLAMRRIFSGAIRMARRLRRLPTDALKRPAVLPY